MVKLNTPSTGVVIGDGGDQLKHFQITGVLKVDNLARDVFNITCMVVDILNKLLVLLR